jgi:hypothetical protein
VVGSKVAGFAGLRGVTVTAARHGGNLARGIGAALPILRLASANLISNKAPQAMDAAAPTA